MLLSIKKGKGGKIEMYREIPFSFEILDSAIFYGLGNLGYRVDNAEDIEEQEDIKILRESLKTLDGEKGLGEVVRLPKSQGEVIREIRTLGSVTYHWMDKELGLRLSALGGLILIKKKNELSECKLFPPPRFSNESDESVKGPILVPFESGKITVVLRHTDRVAHHLMPHAAGLRCIPPTNLL